MSKRFEVVIEDGHKFIRETRDNGYVWKEYHDIGSIVDELNEQYGTIMMWCESSKKIIKLLKENTKPTHNIHGENMYLDIDNDTKRCKYENTIICSSCGYYSGYFLDCRLMMNNNQYEKAKSLGLVK